MSALELELINMSGGHCSLKPYNLRLKEMWDRKKRSIYYRREINNNGGLVFDSACSLFILPFIFFLDFAHRWMLHVCC